MEHHYRAMPADPSESARAAFRRLVKRWAITSGKIFPQANSVSALATLDGVCRRASAFFLDHPLAEPAAKHWTKVAAAAQKRPIDGLERLIVLYGTCERTCDPWTALDIPITSSMEQAVRAGVDLVSKRAVFEVSIDYSRASAKPAFRKDAARIRAYMERHKEELYAKLPVDPSERTPFGTRWGDETTRGGNTFLFKWIETHPRVDRWTVYARGTPAALFAFRDLFPKDVEHNVQAFARDDVPVTTALSMFKSATYDGLLSLTCSVPGDVPERVAAISLQLTNKGIAMEVCSMDPLRPNVGRAIGLKLRLAEID